MSRSTGEPDDGQDAASPREVERELRRMRLPSPPEGLEARLLADVPAARSAARKPAGLAIASAIAAAAMAACIVAAISAPWTHVERPEPKTARQLAAEIENEELSARLLASARILASQEEGQADAEAALDVIRTSYPNTAAWREITR